MGILPASPHTQYILTASKDGKQSDKNIVLSGQNISDEHFKKASEKLNNIKSLNLSWCTGITDKSIEYMFSENKNKNLELISLHGILGITDKSIDILRKNEGILKSLNTIDLVACSNVKNRDNNYIKKIFKNVECFQVFF